MGKRGEGWFILQLLLFALILLAARFQSFAFPLWLRAIGFLFLVSGGVLGTLGMVALGRNLTPFPMPKPGGDLVTSGVYGLVRHPIYAGIILGTLGWALLFATLVGVLLTLIAFVFFDLKSRQEERWLAQSYPHYPDYQRQVKKLVPFLY